MGIHPDHAGAGRRVDLGLGRPGGSTGHGSHGRRRVRGGTMHRRRVGIALAGFVAGAIVLAVIGAVASWQGYAIGLMGLVGAGSGLLMALGLVGALEDGEVQRAIDQARGTRVGPADR